MVLAILPGNSANQSRYAFSAKYLLLFLFSLLLFALLILALPALAEDTGSTESPPQPETEMVLIPGGEFHMGREGHGNYAPRHLVRLTPYYIDKYEVTNAQYLAYCQATDHKLPEFWGLDKYHSGEAFPNHPVMGISWQEAKAYAKWRGARLPTEAEWENAGRGGLLDKRYANGDEHDSTLYTKKIKAPMPVGSFPPNGYGLHDMTGNLVEWVSDWYAKDYYSVSPVDNPTGPAVGEFRAMRGGGWHTGPYCCRVSHRACLQSNWVDFNVGFRCARYKGDSAAELLERAINESGVEAALNVFADIKESPPGDYYFNEVELNDVGYRLIEKEKLLEAIAVFKLIVASYPGSFNAFDSLAEGFLLSGDKEQALINYRKSLELFPGNLGAQVKLEELETR